MGKPAKAVKAGKSVKAGKTVNAIMAGKAIKTDENSDGKPDSEIQKDPKLFADKCFKDHAWCANFADTVLSKMTEAELVRLNCGHKLVKLNEPCDPKRKEQFREQCKRKLTDETAIKNCIKKDIVTIAFVPCWEKQMGGKKRAANLSGDASSSTAIWASVGVIIFLLICAIIAWWYLKGDKKGAGRTAKGGSKSGKSKMTTGKSKLGSRKSQVGSRKSLAGKSRKGSQRSKVSQASKGSAKKSRRSGKKK